MTLTTRQKRLIGATTRLAFIQESLSLEILAHQYQADRGTVRADRIKFGKEAHEGCVDILCGALRLIDQVTDTHTDPTDYAYPFQVARHIPDERIADECRKDTGFAWWPWVAAQKAKYRAWERGELSL